MSDPRPRRIALALKSLRLLTVALRPFVSPREFTVAAMLFADILRGALERNEP